MSQLNLKQILAGDNVSTVIDKLNYNFDQIILNGGGPQGLRGIIGSPGLPGAQGLQGATGPIGENGTYIFAESGITPGDYPFGTGGGNIPRPGDVYLETTASSLNVWELGATGWYLVQSISIPSGSTTILVDDPGPLPPNNIPANSYLTNDINLSERVFFAGASANAFYTSVTPGMLNGDIAGTTSPQYVSTVNSASDMNQLRLLSPQASTVTYGGNYGGQPLLAYQVSGGVIHSFTKGATTQMYQILNGDDYGLKTFRLNLNDGFPGTTGTDAFIVDLSNKTGIGIKAETTSLLARLNVDKSLIVGSSLYHDASFSPPARLSGGMGILSEGNLGVGVKDNSDYTGSFHGDMSGSIAIDVNGPTASASRSSYLRIGSNIFNEVLMPSGYGDYWDLVHNATKIPASSQYRSLTLKGSYYNLGNADTMYFSLTGGTAAPIGWGPFNVSPSIGVANTTPLSLFEVGSNSNRISLGEMGGGAASWDASNYIGLNLHRSPIMDKWARRGDGTYNSGKAIWSGIQNTGLHFSFIGSTGGADVNLTSSTITDQVVTANTRASILSNGAFWNSPNKPAVEGLTDNSLGLYIGFGATGASGDLLFGSSPTLASSRSWFRRPTAFFGEWNSTSSPVIFSTSGLTQSLSISGRANTEILPQYSFYGADTSGLYISDPISVNTASFQYNTHAIGLGIMGMPGVHVGGHPFGSGVRVGIGTRTPYERFQIGDNLTYHDSGAWSGDEAFIGYNLYKNSGTNQILRISGSTTTGGVKKGYVRMSYHNMDLTDTQINGFTRFGHPGTKLTIGVGAIGGTVENVMNEEYDANYKNYRGVMIAPPAIGNPATHINLASKVPQVGIGIPMDTYQLPGTSNLGADSATSAKRGTLSIAAQMRMKPNPIGPFGMTTEDYYNIGLYSYDGYPVAAIQAAGGNPTSYTTKSFNWNFIGSTGDAIYEDISVLYAETDIDLNKKYQRRSYFGDSFRVGVNTVPNFINTPLDISILTSGDGHDTAAFTVAGATAYYTGSQSYYPAGMFKGSLIVDQTPFTTYSDNGRDALYFKDSGLTSSVTNAKTTPVASNTYAGDWGICYDKVINFQSGLSFFKPGLNLNQPLVLFSDNGNVGIGTADFSYTTVSAGFGSPGSPGITPSNSNLILGRGWQYKNSNDDWFRGQGYGNPTAAAGGAINRTGTSAAYAATIGLTGTFQAKLAVDGVAKFVGIFNTSDKRLKNEIATFESGGALEKILKLKPILYQWKPEFNPELNGKIELGFFAQDVEEFFPEAVHTSKTDKFEDEKSLEYNAIFVTAVGAIKDQQEIIEKQAETIKNLEAKLSKIEELLERLNLS